MALIATPKPELVTAPTSEPVTTAEARTHLEISGTDHDAKLDELIEAARQQYELDTGYHVIQQTWKLRLPTIQEMLFTQRPVNSISSITYFDTDNNSQTLATTVYELDQASNALRLKYQQEWPSVATRWDAVTITYVVGENSGASTVDEIHKQAILLLVGHWFENRDMLLPENFQTTKAYELLVRRTIRSTYP